MDIARIYDTDTGGYRVLVDRLWPRGISKERADLDDWVKGIAPSDELRRWFHGGGDYEEFAQRYRAELDANAEFPAIADELCTHDDLVLLTATKEPERSHVSVLAEVFGSRAG